MITTTLGRLVDAVPSLQRLTQHPLGMKAAYDLAKLSRLIEAETSIFRDRLQALRTTFGTERASTPAEQQQGAGPTVLTFEPPQLAAFQAGLTELAGIPVTIDRPPFDLTACASLPITAEDLILLGVDQAWALATVPAEVTNTAETTGEKSI